MQGVNLIPAERRDARLRLLRQRRWVLICTVYTCLLVALCVAARAYLGGSNAAIAAELAQTRQEIDQLQKGITDLKPRLTNAERQLQTVRIVANQPDWSLLLALLANNVKDDTVLRECKLTPIEPPPPPQPKKEAPKPGQPAGAAPAPPPAPPLLYERFNLELSGMGRTQNAVSQLVLRLQETGLFSEVKLVKSNREPFGEDQAVAFQIWAGLAEQRKDKP